MPLNNEREKARQAGLKSGGSSKGWKPEDGSNTIRVLKFKHKVTKDDVAAGLYGKQDAGSTQEEWCFPFTVQYGLVAENRKIPVQATEESIALWKTYNKSNDPADQATAQQIRPVTKYAMNIVDINHPENGVQLYMAVKTVREFIGKYVIDPDFGEAILGVKGRDFKIEFNSKSKDPKGYYSLILMDKEKSRAMNSKVEASVQDLFDPEINSEFTGQVKNAKEISTPDNNEALEKEDLNGKSKVKGRKAAEASEDIFDAD